MIPLPFRVRVVVPETTLPYGGGGFLDLVTTHVNNRIYHALEEFWFKGNGRVFTLRQIPTQFSPSNHVFRVLTDRDNQRTLI